MTDAPRISVVIPLFNEEQVLEELVSRCRGALRACEPNHEILLVDDASYDATAAIAQRLARDTHVVHLRLDENCGQFRTTQYGLAHATAPWICVLDGDLQDPPEVIPSLVRARDDAGPSLSVVFAVKRKRAESLGFRMGRAGFDFLQRRIATTPMIPGAGSYCLMTRAAARQVADLPLEHVNLAAALAFLDMKSVAVGYDKAARYDDASRVGAVGLAKEALGSLLLLSPAGRAWIRRRRALRDGRGARWG